MPPLSISSIFVEFDKYWEEFVKLTTENGVTGVGYPAAKGGELEDRLSGEDEGDHPPHPLQLHLHLKLHLVELAISSSAG